MMIKKFGIIAFLALFLIPAGCLGCWISGQWCKLCNLRLFDWLRTDRSFNWRGDIWLTYMCDEEKLAYPVL